MSNFQLKEIKSVSYEKAEIQKGYTDQSLRINLNSNDIMINSIDEKTKHTYTNTPAGRPHEEHSGVQQESIQNRGFLL